MVINLITSMLLIGIFGVIKLPVRYDRFLSCVMCFLSALLFYGYFFTSAHETESFSLIWGKSQLGDITIDFHASVTTYPFLFVICFISLLSILNNTIFRYEERKCFYNSIILFNLVALNLMVSAQNYVQLITMIFVSDILGYLVLRNVEYSRRFVIYNFFADMCLFMILAMACGRIQSLEMNRLLGYEQIGKHKDFVGLITFLALLIKMGGFLFHGYLIDICSTRFQRMSTVNLLFSPLVGIFLLVKMHNLLQVSGLFMPCYQVAVILTFLGGVSGFIVKRNIPKKLVYLNMAFMGLLMQILAHNSFIWDRNLSLYYVILYFINQIYFKIYLYQNRETDVTKMLNSKEINSLALKTLFIQMAFVQALFMVLILHIASKLDNWQISGLGGVIYFAQSIVINHIYNSSQSHRLDYLNPNAWRFFSFIVNFILIVYGIYLWRSHFEAVLLFAGGFVLLTAFPFGKPFFNFYGISKLQEQDLSQKFFYYILVLPLTYLGRIFWLMIDVFLSEKILTRTISNINNELILAFLRINRHSLASLVLFLILGLSIFILAYYRSALQWVP